MFPSYNSLCPQSHPVKQKNYITKGKSMWLNISTKKIHCMSVFNVNVKSHRHFQENKIKENKTL